MRVGISSWGGDGAGYGARIRVGMSICGVEVSCAVGFVGLFNGLPVPWISDGIETGGGIGTLRTG